MKRFAAFLVVVLIASGAVAVGCSSADAANSRCCNSSCPPPHRTDAARCCILAPRTEATALAPASTSPAQLEMPWIVTRTPVATAGPLAQFALLDSRRGSPPGADVTLSRLCSRQI
jgi:hypothetical protein